jgi:hypothetical protein
MDRFWQAQGEQMESQELILQKQIPRSKNFGDVLAGWLRVYSRIFRQELTEEDATIYGQLLSHLSADTLDAACGRAARTCKFFPKPAEILEHVEKADTTLASLEAENAWQKALAVSQDFGCDYSIASAREIDDPALNAALRAAGGARWLATCPLKELPHQKRIFLEVYAKHKAAPGLTQLCSRQDSPALAEAVHSLAERKSLPH